MHVRIAWEIYNHQQKQKGDSSKKPGDNPLVPSTPTSSLSKAAPNQASTKSSSSDLLASSSAHKRPAPGAPPRTDFMHKRQATDADILQSQLFAPPRPPPPPNPLDPLSNPLLARPPYMSPFGPSPLRKSILKTKNDTFFNIFLQSLHCHRTHGLARQVLPSVAWVPYAIQH